MLQGIEEIRAFVGFLIAPRHFARHGSSLSYFHCLSAVGRLPDGNKGAAHISDIFYRMSFNDKVTLALIGRTLWAGAVQIALAEVIPEKGHPPHFPTYASKTSKVPNGEYFR